MNWLAVVTVATPLLVAAVSAAGAIWLKTISRRTEEVTAEANAHKSEAEARKSDADTNSTEVDVARKLLDDVRQLYREQRSVNVEDRARHDAELATLRTNLETVKQDQANTDRRLTVLLSRLAAHRPWDEAAYAALTANVHNNYPPPPAIDTEDDWIKGH